MTETNKMIHLTANRAQLMRISREKSLVGLCATNLQNRRFFLVIFHLVSWIALFDTKNYHLNEWKTIQLTFVADFFFNKNALFRISDNMFVSFNNCSNNVKLRTSSAPWKASMPSIHTLARVLFVLVCFSQFAAAQSDISSWAAGINRANSELRFKLKLGTRENHMKTIFLFCHQFLAWSFNRFNLADSLLYFWYFLHVLKNPNFFDQPIMRFSDGIWSSITSFKFSVFVIEPNSICYSDWKYSLIK